MVGKAGYIRPLANTEMIPQIEVERFLVHCVNLLQKIVRHQIRCEEVQALHRQTGNQFVNILFSIQFKDEGWIREAVKRFRIDDSIFQPF